MFQNELGHQMSVEIWVIKRYLFPSYFEIKFRFSLLNRTSP